MSSLMMGLFMMIIESGKVNKLTSRNRVGEDYASLLDSSYLNSASEPELLFKGNHIFVSHAEL